MKDKNKVVVPTMTDKEKLRQKLRATIEANRISRLKIDVQDEILQSYKDRRRKAKGAERERLDILVDVIEEKQRQADEAAANMTYADYGGVSCDAGGGCGTSAG